MLLLAPVPALTLTLPDEPTEAAAGRDTAQEMRRKSTHMSFNDDS